MEFALSEDQVALRQGVDSFLISEIPLDTVRAYARGEATAEESIQQGLNSLGITGLMIAEEYGGLGLGQIEAAQIQEAFGYAVAPEGFVSTALASHAIQSSQSSASDALLSGIVDGSVRIATALNELASVRDGMGVSLDSNKASGQSLFVMGAANPTHILIASNTGAFGIVEVSDSNTELEAINTIDQTRTFQKMTLNGAKADLLEGVDADRVLALGRTLIAADTLGAAQAMIDKAVAYAQERKQFDRIIGSFQAVKHMCAEMAAKLEPSRALVWHAAYASDVEDEEALLLSCLAKSHLAEVGTFIARTSTEVHGGMGFTDLVGLHYWFKRIGVNRQLFGSPEATRADAARLQGWTS